jgi:hypothetical protein
MRSEIKTRLATLTAGLAWIGLALELAGFVDRAIDQQLGAMHGVWIFFNYFTNLSNLLAAITISMWARNHRATHDPAQNINHDHLDISSVVAYVWLAGIIYNLKLRNFMPANEMLLLASIIMHDLIPLLFLLFWCTCIPRMRFSVWRILSWLIFPVAYFIYTLVRGEIVGHYPYPFLDVTKFGYIAILKNALGIMLTLLALSMALLVLNSLKKK